MKLISFLALLFVPGIAYPLTLSDLRTEVRINIRDNPANTDFQRYPDITINNYLNEAQREVVAITGIALKTTFYTLTAGTTFYNLPADLTSIQMVNYLGISNNSYRLDQVAMRSLYDKNPMWERMTSGIPYQYWVSNATVPTQNSGTLRISYIPIPTRTSTGTVTIWYNTMVRNMTADTDVPFDNRSNLFPYHMALAYQASMRFKLRESKADEAGGYNSLYQNSITIMKSQVGVMPDYNPGVNIPH